ncbi:MAG: hypothetical protein ACLPXW_03625 [Xanthobacteraceae bacterium]
MPLVLVDAGTLLLADVANILLPIKQSSEVIGCGLPSPRQHGEPVPLGWKPADDRQNKEQ